MKQIVSWESHLILRAADGDQVAFELLSDAHRPVLMSLAMRMLRNADDANDAFAVTVTGVENNWIQWVARIRTVEVSF